MKIFLDFDDTLFDTRAFAKSIQGVFEKYGISEELFWSSYQEMRGSFLIGWCYSPEIQIQRLRKDHIFDAEQLRNELEKCTSDTKQFLFSDVENFLSFFQKNGCTCSILSFGDYDFQMKKIHGTGIDQLVEKVLITKMDKATVLMDETVNESGVVWFVDDKVKFIKSVKNAVPKIKTVFMQRTGRYHPDEPDDCCDYVIANLDEMTKIINKSAI